MFTIAPLRRLAGRTLRALLPGVLAALLLLPGAARAQEGVRLDAHALAGWQRPARAGEAPVLVPLRVAAPLGLHARLLEELPGQPLTLAQVRRHLAAGDFRPAGTAVPNHGNLAPPVWLFLPIENAGAVALGERLYVAEGWADRLDAWLVLPDGRTLHWRGGDARAPARDLRVGVGFGFDALLPPGRSQLFVRADSIDAAALVLRVVPLADTGALEGAARHWLGLVHGFLLALVVSYGLLWLVLRETSLLRYVAYVASYLAMHLAYSGIAAHALWPHAPAIARYAILAGMVLFSSSGLWFARDFLGLRHWAPRVDLAVAWLVRIALGAMAACVVFDAAPAAVVLAFAYIMAFTELMVALGALARWRRRGQATIFLVASLASMAGAFVTTLAVMGRIPFNAVTFRAVEVGVMVEASIWALALGLRLRRHRDDRAHALQLAQHDPLTGLCNRRGFLEQALPVQDAGMRDGRPMSLLLLDIDHFKAINDRFGHDAGDRVLVAVGDRLRALAGDGHVLARWGGEEFVFLLPDADELAGHAFADRVCHALAHMRVALDDGHEATLTASIGVAGSDGSDSLDSLLRQADAALYAAKLAGRNQVRRRETALGN